MRIHNFYFSLSYLFYKRGGFDSTLDDVNRGFTKFLTFWFDLCLQTNSDSELITNNTPQNELNLLEAKNHLNTLETFYKEVEGDTSVFFIKIHYCIFCIAFVLRTPYLGYFNTLKKLLESIKNGEFTSLITSSELFLKAQDRDATDKNNNSTIFAQRLLGETKAADRNHTASDSLRD